jgi:hypothetical protein
LVPVATGQAVSVTDPAFSLRAAKEAADRDETARWVGAFLASRGSDNGVLAAALAQREHWWLGPVEVALDRLERLAGPEPDVVCPIDEDEWEEDVESMEESLDQGWEPPPLLVQYQGGRLLLQDGNHRYEALRRAGQTEGWVLVYFDDPADRERFVARAA